MAPPRIFQVDAGAPAPELIDAAARVLCDGGLVAFPTETVYGLAADAKNAAAVERLNRVKGRPPDKPYSVHVADAAHAREIAGALPALAERLIERFWPGPLTIVVPGPGAGWTGFRLPAHPVAVEFLRRCRRRIVAPSANRSGAPPPTDAREVLAGLGEDVDCVLDAGPTPMGRESTVVRVRGDALEVLREGAIPADTVRAILKD